MVLESASLAGRCIPPGGLEPTIEENKWVGLLIGYKLAGVYVGKQGGTAEWLCFVLD